MKQRCPSSDVLGVGRLRDHRLAFSRYSRTRGCGVADIVPHENAEVWGLVYQLSESDLIGSLDRYEGFPLNYTRLMLPVEMLDDSMLEAWVYSVVDKDEHVQPDAYYLQIIKTAAAELGFPRSYQESLEKF
jgi:gamma-glutamylcyclotransferase (GGCT)/AIG2-like uncharacterized protein YtfP